MRKRNVPFVAVWRMNPGEWTIGSLLKFLTWIYESLWGGKTIYATLGVNEVSAVYEQLPKGSGIKGVVRGY